MNIKTITQQITAATFPTPKYSIIYQSTLYIYIYIYRLLDIKVKETEKCLLELHTEIFTKVYDVRGAEDVRNSWINTIYARLFDYIVGQINRELSKNLAGGDKAEKTQCIGLLDIYGFEILEKNSLEQLCINYANEKLHQHFVNHTFKMEASLYLEEEIPFDPTEFRDNLRVLQVIEGNEDNVGIMNIMEDIIRTPQPSDTKLLEGLLGKLKSTNILGKDVKEINMFYIEHYAGQVHYDIQGFIDKAKDLMSPNIYQLMFNSNFPLIQLIFKQDIQNKLTDLQIRRNLGIKFHDQLDHLISTFDQSQPHYIKCIMPNDKMLPFKYDPILVRNQLR